MSFEPKIISDDDPQRDELQRDVAEVARLRAEGAALDDRNSGEFRYEVARQPEPVWNDAQELALSDDLALLAEQLVEDANFLARRHPADATHHQRAAAVAGAAVEAAQRDSEEQAGRQTGMSAPRRRFARRNVGWASAAAAVLVVAGIASLVWNANQTENHGGSPADGIATNQSEAPHVPPPTATAGIAETGPRVRTLLTEPRGEEPTADPAEFIRDVSGAELEGMLDLLERLEPEETGIWL